MISYVPGLFFVFCPRFFLFYGGFGVGGLGLRSFEALGWVLRVSFFGFLGFGLLVDGVWGLWYEIFRVFSGFGLFIEP